MMTTLAECSHVRFECVESYPDYYPEEAGGKPGGRSCEPAVFDGLAGKDVAEQLGISEPTVSRHLQRIRDLLRRRLAETVATYSFTEEEQREAQRAGLGEDDGMFDDALREIYHRQSRLVLEDEAAASSAF